MGGASGQRTTQEPLKVSKRSKELIRLGAAIEHCTMGQFLERAVREFLVTNREEIEAGMAHAREVLGVN